MHSELEDFAQALLQYVKATLQSSGEMPDYCQEAVKILDARNQLFASAGTHKTDEEHGIYALRDLCALDDETMELAPDLLRCKAVGRDFGLQ
ncbi:MAG: hypothetical protein HUK09_02095 [Bacteroidaceae bacterium]|nr:hypothetical protein [Bacteroidaceae bacterium]